MTVLQSNTREQCKTPIDFKPSVIQAMACVIWLEASGIYEAAISVGRKGFSPNYVGVMVHANVEAKGRAMAHRCPVKDDAGALSYVRSFLKLRGHL